MKIKSLNYLLRLVIGLASFAGAAGESIAAQDSQYVRTAQKGDHVSFYVSFEGQNHEAIRILRASEKHDGTYTDFQEVAYFESMDASRHPKNRLVYAERVATNTARFKIEVQTARTEDGVWKILGEAHGRFIVGDGKDVMWKMEDWLPLSENADFNDVIVRMRTRAAQIGSFSGIQVRANQKN